MLKQRQASMFHNPGKGVYGDCVRTAIACLLDLERDEVPQFNDGVAGWSAAERDEVISRVREYLAPRRTLWCFERSSQEPREVRRWVARRNPECTYLLLGGTKHEEINHLVLCQGEEVVWNTCRNADIVSGLWPDRDIFDVWVIGERT